MRSRTLLKTTLVFLIGTLAGIWFGKPLAFAESKNVWVDPVGMVGTASTKGYPSTGAIGRSSSGIALYTIGVHIKIWHTGPLLQDQDVDYLYNKRVAWTDTLTSSGHGDYAVSRHEFRYVLGKPASIVYTSDNGDRSCYTAWSTFVFSC